jgi:hypothetical protein
MELMMHDNSTIGQTFDLAGPELINKAQLLDIVNKYTHQNRRIIYIPHILKSLLSFYTRVVYWHHPGWSPDEVIRERINHVPSTTGPNGEKTRGWNDLLGMTRLEKIDGLITKQHMRLYLSGLDSVPHSKRKTEAEKAREAEMNRIL